MNNTNDQINSVPSHIKRGLNADTRREQRRVNRWHRRQAVYAFVITWGLIYITVVILSQLRP